MSDIWMIFGAWAAAGLTICLFSFLYKDNPFFKIAEHLYLGAGMGWWFQIYLFNIGEPKVWEPLRQGHWSILIPALLGLSLVAQFFPKISWISRYGFTFMMGYGAGLAIPATISTDFLHQIGGTIEPFTKMAGMSPWALFNSLVIALGVICVLLYFFFSVEHKGIIKKASNVGIYFLMIYFGASFGNTVMARFSLLYGRFDDLYEFSSARYFYASPIILAIMVLFFVLTRKKGTEEPGH